MLNFKMMSFAAFWMAGCFGHGSKGTRNENFQTELSASE